MAQKIERVNWGSRECELKERRNHKSRASKILRGVRYSRKIS